MAKKPQNDAASEASKDTGRLTIFGAISTLATYFLQMFFPDMPFEVQGAVLALLVAGLVWVDSYIHNRTDIKANGLVPF